MSDLDLKHAIRALFELTQTHLQPEREESQNISKLIELLEKRNLSRETVRVKADE